MDTNIHVQYHYCSVYWQCTFVPSNDAPRPMTKGTHDRVGSLGKKKTEQINFYSVIKK